MALLCVKNEPIIDEFEYMLDRDDMNLLNTIFTNMFGLDNLTDVRVYDDDGMWIADVKALRKRESKYCDRTGKCPLEIK